MEISTTVPRDYREALVLINVVRREVAALDRENIWLLKTIACLRDFIAPEHEAEASLHFAAIVERCERAKPSPEDAPGWDPTTEDDPGDLTG